MKREGDDKQREREDEQREEVDEEGEGIVHNEKYASIIVSVKMKNALMFTKKMEM